MAKNRRFMNFFSSNIILYIYNSKKLRIFFNINKYVLLFVIQTSNLPNHRMTYQRHKYHWLKSAATRILPTILSEFYSEFCSVSKVVADHDDLQTHWRYMLCKLVNSEQIFLIQTTSNYFWANKNWAHF